MKFLILILLFCFYKAEAQNTYLIYYKGEVYQKDVLTDKESVFKSYARQLINDNNTFFYFHPNGEKKDKNSKKKILGDKLIHHAVWINKKTNELLHEIAWPKNTNSVLVDTVKYDNWIYVNQSKKILDYNCKLAFNVNENNDTTMAWYTQDLNNFASFFVYPKINGVALEIFDQAKSTHFFAEKVEQTDIELVAPKAVKRIMLQEHLSKIK